MTEHTAGPAVDAAAIGAAVAVLLRGGLVAMPTETVYGLAADADDAAAVAAIFAAKGRPADHPVIVHVAGSAALDAWARSVPPAARRLADRYWPGPLTLVLPRSARARDAVTGGQDTVALRAPAHPWAHALIAALAAARGDPAAAVAAPSANRYGRISPTTAAHVRADLGEKPAGVIDLVLDAGPAAVGIESTIVDLSRPVARLLRPGAITRAMLEAALGAPLADRTSEAPRVSGDRARHYAPRTPMELVAPERLAARIAELAAPVAVLAPPGLLADAPPMRPGPPAPPAAVKLLLPAPADAAGWARRLYADLHRLDAAGATRILVVAPPATPEWEAIHDRLRRACAGAGLPT